MAAKICYRLVTIFIERLRVTNDQTRDAIRWGLEATGYASGNRSLSDANPPECDMAEPAKLQLLTRKPGETGFQLHEIESSQAYLGYRPQRVSNEFWEIIAQPSSPDGRRNFILKNLQRDRYLLIDSHESFLWDFSTAIIPWKRSPVLSITASVLSITR
jgi:hypothetical protein